MVDIISYRFVPWLDVLKISHYTYMDLFSGKSLLWVAVLGVIVIYIFALVTFAMLRGNMDPTPDGEQNLYCRTLYECTLALIRYGLIGDLFEVSTIMAIMASFFYQTSISSP